MGRNTGHAEPRSPMLDRAKTAGFGVPSFVPKWRALGDSNLGNAVLARGGYGLCESGPRFFRIGCIRADCEREVTIFAGSLPQYFGVAMDPAQACAVRYIKGKVEGHALRRQPRLDAEQ